MRKSTFILAPLCMMAIPAFAGDRCGPQTTRGFWGFTCDGYLAPAPAAPLMPARFLGTCVGDRTGHITCEGTANVGGQILIQALTGQANNNENCTGTIKYTQTIFGQPAPDLNVRYFILDDGNVIKGLPTDPGQVLSCVLNRMGSQDGH
jgi:hypothetical protein